MANGALIVWVKTISERLRQAMPGKRIQLDDETLEAVEALASRTGKSFQSLADEAFAPGQAQAASRVEGRARAERKRAREAQQQPEASPASGAKVARMGLFDKTT